MSDRIWCKVLVLGEEGTGKTCFVKNKVNSYEFTKGSTDSKFIQSIGCDFTNVDVRYKQEDVKLQLWDTHSKNALSSLGQTFFRNCHVALLLFDMTDMASFDRVKEMYEQLQRVQARWTLRGMTYLLVGNKLDVLQSNDYNVTRSTRHNSLSSTATVIQSIPSSPKKQTGGRVSIDTGRNSVYVSDGGSPNSQRRSNLTTRILDLLPSSSSHVTDVVLPWCQRENIAFLPISAIDGQGVPGVLELLGKMAMQSSKRRDVDRKLARVATSFHSLDAADGEIKVPQVEDRSRWMKDEDSTSCFSCRAKFGFFLRKHHCRKCGFVFCDNCSSQKIELPIFGYSEKVRVCDSCYRQELMATT